MSKSAVVRIKDHVKRNRKAFHHTGSLMVWWGEQAHER